MIYFDFNLYYKYEEHALDESSTSADWGTEKWKNLTKTIERDIKPTPKLL